MDVSALDKEKHIIELSNMLEQNYFSWHAKLSPADKRDIMVEVAQIYQRKFMLHTIQNSSCKLVTKRTR